MIHVSSRTPRACAHVANPAYHIMLSYRTPRVASAYCLKIVVPRDHIAT